MKRPLAPRAGAVLLGAVVTLVFALTPAPAQQAETKKAKESKAAQKIAGAIVKAERTGTAEPTSTEDDHHSTITVNTAVVWRDWVRDQTKVAGKAQPDSKNPATGIGTAGEPAAPGNLVKIRIGHRTPIRLRYRSATDEAGRGGNTPAAAAANEEAEDPAADTAKTAKRESRKESRKAQRLAVADLKPGTFVEVHYHHRRDHNQAERVIVFRPVGGSMTPAAESAPGAGTAKKAD
jgi:hypothetical protein